MPSILRLFFSFERGDYGFGWRLIAVGFFLLTIADLVFTYATWEEIYYPDMKANLVSRLFVDAPYTISYLFWLLGIFALGILLRQQKPASKIVAPIHIPRYAHIILSVAADDSILRVSDNVSLLVDSNSILGRNLLHVLPFNDRDASMLLSGLHGEGMVSDLPVLFLNSSGKLLALKICGMAIMDASGAYLGSNPLVRFPVEDASADASLSQESRGLAEYLMATCGSSFPTEVGDFLLEYFLVFLEELFQLADKEDGATMTASLVESLKDICARHNWPLQFNQHTGITKADYPLDILRQSLPVLLQSAREFITRMEDENTVEARIQEIHAQIAPEVHAEVARYLNQGVALS